MDMDDALKTLVEHAAEEFGFSPRDIYDTVFKPFSVKRTHTDAMAEFSHSDLSKSVINFYRLHQLDILLLWVIAVDPIPLQLDMFVEDEWVFNFKSSQIARNVMEYLQQGEVEVLQEMFRLFKRIPRCGGLTRWVFKGMVHHKFRDGWQQPIPLYTHMLNYYSAVTNTSFS